MYQYPTCISGVIYKEKYSGRNFVFLQNLNVLTAMRSHKRGNMQFMSLVQWKAWMAIGTYVNYLPLWHSTFHALITTDNQQSPSSSMQSNENTHSSVIWRSLQTLCEYSIPKYSDANINQTDVAHNTVPWWVFVITVGFRARNFWTWQIITTCSRKTPYQRIGTLLDYWGFVSSYTFPMKSAVLIVS